MALSENMRDRFERLRKRLLDRRVMPFVGAGISTQARVDGDPAFEPTLTHMKQQLVARLRQELQALASSHPNGDQHEVVAIVSYTHLPRELGLHPAAATHTSTHLSGAAGRARHCSTK